MRFLVVTCALLATVSAAVSNVPPATPTVTEPSVDGQLVNPSDVHMETAPFADADPGDGHLCTDWEVWTLSPSELVWRLSCIGGVERVHTHIGDGQFMNSHDGRSEFRSDTDYELRVRHRDDSGDPATEWSDWGARFFTTVPATAISPLRLDDILESPVPAWTGVGGVPFVLPAASPQPSVTIESPAGQTILRFEGLDGLSNFLDNPPPIATHEPARVRIDAGGLAGDLVLPETDLAFTTHDGQEFTIYLPSARVSPGADAFYWVAESGATYGGTEGQSEPDFSDLLRGAPVPWVARQSGYVVEVVAGGLTLPVNIAFVPNPGPNPEDPRYYITELYGTIKVVTNAGVVSDYVTGLLNFNPSGNFPGSGEQGLTGIVVEPVTGDLIVGYLRDQGGPHYPRISRFSSSDGGLTADNEIVLLEMFGETQGQSHQISNFSIGPDGKLYVHMGDGFDAGTAQNLDSYRGKVLRLNLNGTIPTDNPFFDGPPFSSRDFIYAYGLRNPFGGAWRPTTGDHYQVENGPSVDRFSRIERGVNYLWDGSNESMENFAIHNWVPSTGPTNIVFIDPSVFGGSNFPPEMHDRALVALSGPTWASGPQSNGKRIEVFELAPDGALVSGPDTLVEYVGTGKATAVGLAAGPDGLYFTDLYKDQDYASPIDIGAQVLRVRFIGNADFAASPTTGPAPLTVDFTDLSTVPGASAWFWEFGDGTTSTEQNPTHTFDHDGVYDIRLTVTGDDGVRVDQKNGYIRVGFPVSLALIGGSDPPFAADAALRDFLTSVGFAVEVYDDDPGNRPSAQQIADSADLVLLSSTIASGNIGNQFVDVPVPVIFWEHALLSADRMAMAGDSGTVGSVMSVNIIDNTHPITAHEDLGNLTVYAPGATMSVAREPYPSGVEVLATRAFDSDDAAILVADTGAALLGGRTAPARRVFLFLEDGGFLNATDEAEHLIEHAICWAAELESPVIVEGPADVTAAAGETVQFSVDASGSSPLGYIWRHNGAAIPNAGGPVLTITNLEAADGGEYEVEVSNLCGSATSAPATLTVTECPPDLNGDGSLDFFDIQIYLNLFSAEDPAADVNDDGTLDFFDVQAFLAAFSAGCP